MRNFEECQKAIDALIEHRKRVSGESDDFYGVKLLPVDYREANLLLAGLSEQEQVELLERTPVMDVRRQLIEFALSMTPPAADYQRPTRVNMPVKRLLADFRNKKSKRVATARKELLERYEHLDTTQQLAIRKALLEGTGKTDWVKGCRLAMERWDGSEQPLVEQVWQAARAEKDSEAWFWSSRVLLRQEPDEFVAEHQQDLTRLSEDDSNPTLYYYLCLRLANQRGFRVEKERLHIGDYYRLVYNRQLPFDQAAWQQDLYRATAELYAQSHPWLSEPRQLTKQGDQFPQYRQPRHSYQNYWMRLTEFPTISDLLLYGSLLGATGIEDYLQYADRVEERLYQTDPQPNYRHSDHAAEAVRNCCPELYQFYFEDYSQSPEHDMNYKEDTEPEELEVLPF